MFCIELIWNNPVLQLMKYIGMPLKMSKALLGALINHKFHTDSKGGMYTIIWNVNI